MYDLHQPLIERAMRASVYGFKRGVMFAVCSMRVQVVRVPEMLDDIEAGDPQRSAAHLWGNKARARMSICKRTRTCFGGDAPKRATRLLLSSCFAIYPEWELSKRRSSRKCSGMT